ncbi:hypothetical protein [Vitiosangium sp. GDMCC 1.1324]|uniref:hypothetical protein n=1 Tax=Vitiosangium sp. (strain GDMCC 1.1324) TaxID=2138576 RepID=UPI000D36E240|nr:hypothetical protein [Vitiosangium sp. GDMCC 1.1324]PTL80286.1 hypothetical protein DAT35_30315 [Vitiosangium sp. GDMCC 1.1324]
MSLSLLNRLAQSIKPAVRQVPPELKLPARPTQPSSLPQQQLRDTFSPARTKTLVDLQGGPASSLLTEDARDAKRNCLDQAVDYIGKLPASEQKNAELVMLKDQRAGAEGSSGHVVVRQGDQVVDPASGKKYASTAEYLAKNPQYSEAGTVSGEDAMKIFATRAGSPERQAALDAAKVSPDLQQMMVADNEPTVLAPEDPQVVQQRRTAEEAAQYDYYKAMIERNGGTFDSTPGKRNMLAIRHDTNTKTNDGKGAYDDKAVLLWVDEQGGKHCTSYNACTEPGEKMLEEDYGEAIGGDDRKDLGRLPAGSYTYHLRNDYGRELAGFFKRGPFDNEGTRQVLGAPDGADWQAEYDIDHDGDFDENVRGKDGEEILWHMGRDDNPRSAGCQTMPPEEWRRFLKDLDLKEDQSINYTLVQEDTAKGNVVYSPPKEGTVEV